MKAMNKASIRQRDLPAHVVVYHVIALALYAFWRVRGGGFEPRRDCRRPFCLSDAAIADCSGIAYAQQCLYPPRTLKACLLGAGLLGHHPTGLALDPGKQPIEKIPAAFVKFPASSKRPNTAPIRSFQDARSRSQFKCDADQSAIDIAPSKARCQNQ